MVVVKVFMLKSKLIVSKLLKKFKYNFYKKSTWPNDILYIFLIIILSVLMLLLVLSVIELFKVLVKSNVFSTPLEILPEWYFFQHLIY